MQRKQTWPAVSLCRLSLGENTALSRSERRPSGGNRWERLNLPLMIIAGTKAGILQFVGTVSVSPFAPRRESLQARRQCLAAHLATAMAVRPQCDYKMCAHCPKL